MGYLWSEDSLASLRERFKDWDKAELDWEREMIKEHFDSSKNEKTVVKRRGLCSRHGFFVNLIN